MGLNPRRQLVALAAILLVGLVLRTINVSQQALWGDEALTVLISQRPAVSLMFLPLDPTAGLYYLLHKGLIPPEAGLAAIRSIAVVAGSLAIVAAYAVGRLAAGKGLEVAALVALSPPLIDYSQEARAYSLLVLLVLCSAAGLLWWARSVESKRAVGPLALFLGAALLSYYTHFVAIFWIGPAIVTAIVIGLRRASPEARMWLLAGLAATAILAAPETLRLLMYPREGFSWLTQAGPAEFISTLGNALLPSALWNGDPVVSAIVVVVAIGALAWRARSARPEVLAVIGILLGAPLAMWAFGYLVLPIYMPRVILPAVAGFALLLALALPRAWLAVAAASFAASLIVSGTVREKEDWSMIARTLQSEVRPGDAIVICPGWKGPALRHAITTAIPAPLILAWDNRLMLMEPRLGATDHWPQAYFSVLEVGPRRDGRAVMEAARRVWVVTSNCKQHWAGRKVVSGHGVAILLLNPQSAVQVDSR